MKFTFASRIPLLRHATSAINSSNFIYKIQPDQKDSNGNYYIHFKDGVLGFIPASEIIFSDIDYTKQPICVFKNGYIPNRMIFSQTELFTFAFEKVKSSGSLCYGQVVDKTEDSLIVDIGYGYTLIMPETRLSLVHNTNHLKYIPLNSVIRLSLARGKDNGLNISCRPVYEPWDILIKKFPHSEKMPGIVHAITDNGIFVELAPYLCGRLLNGEYDLSVDELVNVRVLTAFPDKHHLNLSLCRYNTIKEYMPDFTGIIV